MYTKFLDGFFMGLGAIGAVGVVLALRDFIAFIGWNFLQ